MTISARDAFGDVVGQRVFGWSLLARPDGIGHWRRQAAGVLTMWGAPVSSVELVRLGVSELLGNVVKHVADERCYLRLVRCGAEVEVQVIDADPRFPEFCQPGQLSESGRGLALVAELAGGIGWRRMEEGMGKRVYFRCPLVQPANGTSG
ncbi:ATP-binding protein [Streptomyces sp. SM12]|uniref:ATP-binding protein n=1 Tax=Streptomyces sp. SM12 TaxID=1071602 RepID=UPI000CD4FE80|nr:ATP-binding protein [Streptomyces sp. SM12]